MNGNSLPNLDLDVQITPCDRVYKYQISLPCYGRGKRLCDLQIPQIPRFLITSSKDNENHIRPSEARTRPGRGRGRRRQSAVKEDHLSNQGNVPERLYASSDSRSVCSDQSSRDSEQFLSVENCTHQQEASHQPPRPQFSTEHGNFDDHLQTPPNKLTSTKDEKFITDSPPLKVLGDWKLNPPRVIQFEGIPLDFDLNTLHEVLSFYGPIVDWEEKRIEGSLALRMKFQNDDTCELIELNMDKSDFTGTVTCYDHHYHHHHQYESIVMIEPHNGYTSDTTNPHHCHYRGIVVSIHLSDPSTIS